LELSQREEENLKIIYNLINRESYYNYKISSKSSLKNKLKANTWF